MRQLWDNRGSVIIEGMKPRELALARPHARSGDAIGTYLGSGDALDRALADSAELYADQNELDYAVLSAGRQDRRRQGGDGALAEALCRFRNHQMS